MGYLDYLKHGRKMLVKRGQLPVYLVYFITDACNAKCKHCLLADGAHPGWEEPSMAYRKQELSLEEIDKVAASMGKGSLMFLLPTGGEPFLRKDIGEIVKIFHKNTGVRNVGIPTNGSTTARTISIVKDLCESCPDLDLHIDVSLDGVGALHDEIRVFPGLFKRSIETYKALREIEKNVRAMLASTFARLDLVTREEFDVQTAVLARTREKLAELEAKLAELEKRETNVR